MAGGDATSGRPRAGGFEHGSGAFFEDRHGTRRARIGAGGVRGERSAAIAAGDLRRPAAGTRRAVHHRPARQAQHLRLAQSRTVVAGRSVEHTSELQSLMRISYALLFMKKQKKQKKNEK